MTEPTVDDDSVDLIFQQRGSGSVFRSPRLEVQVKCTDAATITSHYIAYPLKIKNYDKLRLADFLVPRILIVVVVPDSLTDWLNHSELELAMRRCGYWLSLLGMPANHQRGFGDGAFASDKAVYGRRIAGHDAAYR